MNKEIYLTMPHDYTVCEHHDCPRAASCLHQIAYGKLIESKQFLRLINPKNCSKNDQCKYFRDSQPVAYTKGFKEFQKKMFPQQYEKFMSILVNQFGYNPYFERRRGDRPMPPQEQEIVLDALRKAGIQEEMKFDDYVELINWYD